ncbi:cAMP factor [Cutibacterium acnes JCM 18916]|nr:cAMP factor [Cutibacterium acnes JCM 18916]
MQLRAIVPDERNPQMKAKFLAAPLIVGALMAPAAFSGATAHAAPVAP